MNGIVFGRVALAAFCLATVTASPGQAAIRCNGAYQINSQGEFRSPYCEDGYLAEVARSFGWRVTGAQIRASYSLKGEVCRLVGNDIRVDAICNQFRPERHDRNCKFIPC